MNDPAPPRPQVTHALLMHLAELARLELPESRAAELARQLDRLVAAFSDLAAADFSEPTDTIPLPGASKLSLRDDSPSEPLPSDQALANAPRQASDCFVVPRVIDA